MKMSKDAVGAFVDAVYAIAVTILALEIPAELDAEFSLASFVGVLLDYAMSFVIIFSLWLQHRRINEYISTYNRPAVWLTGLILLLVCLIPRATTFVFDYGGNVTIAQLEQSLAHGAGWSRAEIVDITYVGIVLAADFSLLLLSRFAYLKEQKPDFKAVHRSKSTITTLTVVVLGLSFLTPFENRYFLLLMPLILMFENQLAGLIFRSK
ncbi:MAG: putative membrane protein [Lysobacterales bacterium]|jgi:uncharacterized membrane protein